MRTTRRSSRSRVGEASPVKIEQPAAKNEQPDDGDDDEMREQHFTFNGEVYETYQKMVDAKRKRNQDVLRASGLLDAKAAVDDAILEDKRKTAMARGIKRTNAKSEPLPRRKSSRLSGSAAPNIYVEEELARGKVTIGGTGLGSYEFEAPEPEFYGNRVNDGGPLSVPQAVELTGTKWNKEGTVDSCVKFMGDVLPRYRDSCPGVTSPTSVRSSIDLESRIAGLNLDQDVAKVVPDRIYSVTCHPSSEHLLVAAGDKKGFLGLWNVDSSAENDGVHLFKPHSGAISSLAWDSTGSSLLSSSYDGTVRLFDINRQTFDAVFASYDEQAEFKNEIGYGTDSGYNSWIQSMEIDHRYESSKAFFLSTSEGNVMHIDLRIKGKVTFNQAFSERKINTVSLHRDGNVMATAGLTGVVEFFDLRKLQSKNSSKKPKSFANLAAGRSINSAYFSPSGTKMITTTQSNTLDILDNSHTAKGVIKPMKRIKHDNQTGRWLSTFMAKWNPNQFSNKEIFVVGSMSKPRCMELYDCEGDQLSELRGDALTAVASRCCFHPNASKLIVVGGNSSGRVTVAR